MLQKLRSLAPILLLTGGHGAVDSYLGLLQVLAPGLAAHLKMPLGDVVVLVGAGALLNNLFQPLTGYIMGRRNMSWVLWFSVILSGLPVFMGFAPNYAALALLILLGSIGTGLYHPEAALAAHDAAGDKAYLGVPLFMAGGAAVFAVVTPLCIYITENWGFPALAWLWLPGLALGGAFLFQHRDRKKRHPSLIIRPRSKRMTKVVDGSMSFWPLLAVGCFFCTGSGLFLAILSSHYALVFGSGAAHWSGWVLLVMGALGSLSSFAWGWLSRKHDFYRLSLISQLIAVPLFLLMAYPPSPAFGFAVAFPLSVVSPAAIHPIGVTLARNAAGSTQAMRTSLMIGGTYSLTSVAIMVAGYLLRREVPSAWLILFVAGCSLAAAVLSLWQCLAKRRPTRAD